MTLVGLDVHARQTHAAVFDRETGELRVCRLRMAPEEVVTFLAGLPTPVLAVYEAGPTGFGLARQGSITKAGSPHARRRADWTFRPCRPDNAPAIRSPPTDHRTSP